MWWNIVTQYFCSSFISDRAEYFYRYTASRFKNNFDVRGTEEDCLITVWFYKLKHSAISKVFYITYNNFSMFLRNTFDNRLISLKYFSSKEIFFCDRNVCKVTENKSRLVDMCYLTFKKSRISLFRQLNGFRREKESVCLFRKAKTGVCLFRKEKTGVCLFLNVTKASNSL